MRKLAILSFVSLDGVMQAPMDPEEDSSGGFKHGGWAAPYFAEVMEQVEEVAMAQPTDLLFGRKTYEIFAGHWPNVQDSGHAAQLNAARKYVVTSQPDSLTWQNSEPVSGHLADAIRALKSRDGPTLQVHGSWQLIQALLAHDLIDLFRLWTFPVVLGDGKRLFQEANLVPSLALERSSASENGVVMTLYRRAR